jgi:dTMP kinase
MKFKKNLFISFEGPEASGKSSQIKLLSSFLKKNKIPYLITREPGGTIVGEKLRKIILDKNEPITPTEEILLLMSSRLNHINNIIKPALKAGKIVISDRFADSTFVYQGFVNKYGLTKTKDLHKSLLKNFLPSKTFLFLLPSKIINERLKQRKVLNKYDKIDLAFHNQVIKGYKIISKNNNRFYLLNATNSIKDIHYEIIKVLQKIK